MSTCLGEVFVGFKKLQGAQFQGLFISTAAAEYGAFYLEPFAIGFNIKVM